MQDVTLKLFMSAGSSSMAPHIALNEVGAQFELVSLSFRLKEHQAPHYLAVNPEGKVPTLLIDGKPLTEVAAILFFIARYFPQSGLIPAEDIVAEAEIISWMSFFASTLHPARRQGVEAALRAYANVEKHLANRRFLLGGRYSIADIHLFRLFWRFRNGLPLRDGTLPALEAFYGRMMQRPAVIMTLEAEEKLGYELPA